MGEKEHMLEGNIERFEQEIKSLNIQYDTLKSQYDNERREFSQKLCDSQTVLSERTKEKDNLEQKLLNITNEMSILQKDVNDLTVQFKEQIKSKEMEVNSLQVELNTAKETCA